MNAIETVGLTKKFRRVQAVHDVNLQVAEGGIYALMGPNGAGKSTLIKMLMNLVRPTVGEARMLGGSSEFLRGERLEQIGYVSENQKMPDWMTVASYMQYWRPFYPSWNRALEEKLTKQFELPLKQKLKRMSRGMRMKASLVSVLAYRPKVIVLDEPLSGLDPLVRDQLMEGLLGLADGATVLFSSHDLAEIEHFANHVGYMEGGRLLISESIEHVRQRFCKVTAWSEAAITPPASIPAEWTRLKIDGQHAHWIEAAYDPELSIRRAREALGQVAVKSEPLTLREVFLTLAYQSRSVSEAGGAQ
jgi:ABC-2 type transport system ATP-binding protein